MRTDVKVGLVCVLALVVAVITYFAMETKSKDTNPTADSHTVVARDHGTEVASPATPATPAADPTAVSVSPPADALASPPATPAVTPTDAAPPVAFGQAPLAQVPSTYAPPATTLPAGGSTLYPPPSGPRSLLPPSTTGAPPLTNDPAVTTPSSPSLINHGDRPGEPEPSLHRDPLLETPTTPPAHAYTPATPLITGGSSSYTVISGDNLTNIAKKNHTTVAALKAANPTINPDRLKIKQVINLPAPGADVPAAPSVTTRPGHSSTRPATAHSASTRPAHSSTTRPAAVAGGSYTVKKGDTLRKIAKSVYGDEKLWRRIFRVNRGELASANAITPGMVLKIPAR